MKKILVTTDFSTNSRAAIRFAIQLASQNNYQLTFFHCYSMMLPTGWSNNDCQAYEKKQIRTINEKLYKFVSNLYKSLSINTHLINYVAIKGLPSPQDIMEYAEENEFDFICLSRKGNGKTARLFGSTTSSLIKKSKIPIIAIPKFYRSTGVTTISYASDLYNLDKELNIVSDFAKPLGAKVELLHFKALIDYLMNANQLNGIKEKLKKFNITAHFETIEYEKTLINNINKVIKKSKPSLIIMFTNQKRTLFEKIFVSSISAEYASTSTVPLLIFNK